MFKIILNIKVIKYQNDSDNVDLNQSGFNNQLNLNLKNTNIQFFSSFLSSKKENGANQLRRPQKNFGLNISKKLTLIFWANLNFKYYI